MTDIKSMTIDELKELMTQIGEKPFRAEGSIEIRRQAHGSAHLSKALRRL